MTLSFDGSFKVASGEVVTIGLLGVGVKRQQTSVSFDASPDKGRIPGPGDNYSNTMTGVSGDTHKIAFGCTFDPADAPNGKYDVTLTGSGGGKFTYVVPIPFTMPLQSGTFYFTVI